MMLIPGCFEILSLVTFTPIGVCKARVKSLNSIARTAGVHIMVYESVHPCVRSLSQSVKYLNSFDQITHHSARNDQFAFSYMPSGTEHRLNFVHRGLCTLRSVDKY